MSIGGIDPGDEISVLIEWLFSLGVSDPLDGVLNPLTWCFFFGRGPRLLAGKSKVQCELVLRHPLHCPCCAPACSPILSHLIFLLRHASQACVTFVLSFFSIAKQNEAITAARNEGKSKSNACHFIISRVISLRQEPTVCR